MARQAAAGESGARLRGGSGSPTVPPVRKWFALTLIGVALLTAAFYAFLERPPRAAAETGLPQIRAFTSDSYRAYLDATVAYREGRTETKPDPRDFLHTFTLVGPAEVATRVQTDPETWFGSIATFRTEEDPVPSTWVVRTTLTGELEGIAVLSDTHNPL